MSRAVNIDATREDVIAMAQRRGVVISAIEPLLPSGTHVVLMNQHGAATITKAFGSKVLTGRVTRVPLRPLRP